MCTAATTFNAFSDRGALAFHVKAASLTGYAVMQTDARGMHKSQGHAGVLTDRDAEDYYDVIEWAASQSWCDGGVRLSGVSYLATSQWRVAALRPPHLKAIIPWETVSDLYREMAFHGGIPETGFIPIWWKKRMMSGRNKQFDFAEDFLAEIDRHPLEDLYWRGNQTALERINAPALVVALHPRPQEVGNLLRGRSGGDAEALPRSFCCARQTPGKGH